MSLEMQQRAAAENEADPRVDLAVERTELALERTHLAWIRTMFTLITAGLAIDKAGAYLHSQRVAKNEALVSNTHAVGIFLTSFCTVLLLVETFQFIKRNKQLAAMKMGKATFFSAGSVLSFLVLFLGIVLIVVMLTTN